MWCRQYQRINTHRETLNNKMPLAPLGCAVQLFENRDKRGTWAEHATDGWYIGTSPEHYRCHKIYVKTTRSERISDTVFFKHRYITQPTLTPNDTLVKAIDDLTHAIRGQKNHKGAAHRLTATISDCLPSVLR